MPVPPNPIPTRAFVSLSELAEDLLGLSRARVYELIDRGALPSPIYDIRSRRPIFDSELQRQALSVRQTGVGIDGSAVIFYRRDRHASTAPPQTDPARSRRRTAVPSSNRFGDLIYNLQSLGVAHANEQSVSTAVAECFPQGTDGQQEADIIRAVFRHLRRPESA